jgi:HEAT repeat protein
MRAVAAPPTDVILSPDQYSSVPVCDLLAAAANGQAPFDHRLLKALLDRFESAVPDLVRFGMDDRPDDLIDLEPELVAIFRYKPTPLALPFLTEAVRRQPDDVSEELLDAFCRIGPVAVDPLLDLYRRLDPDEGGEVSFLLAALRVCDPRILDLLVGRLAVDPGDAAIQLGLYGDPAAKPALEKLLREFEANGDVPPGTVSEIRSALQELDEPREEETAEPYDIWADYPETALPLFDHLSEQECMEFLGSPVAEYRARAAESLGSELSAAVKARLFDMARIDPEAPVRGACWERLRHALPDADIRAAMIERLSDETAPQAERIGALFGLSWEPDDPVVRRHILDFYNSPDTRAQGLEAMWRSGDRAFSEYAIRHLDDEDPELRRQAIVAVGNLEIHAQAGRLTGFFDNEDFREDAIFAYARAVPGEVSRMRMRQLFNKIDELAGGLSEYEAAVVESAINLRLEQYGLEPLAITGEDEEELEPEPAPAAPAAKPGRNDPCPCGSGKKYKKCCGR